jgi:hypothetical protein
MATAETNDGPSMPRVNEFLPEALDQRWKDYRAELKRCRAEFSNEAVHDLRASARRSRMPSPAPLLSTRNRSAAIMSVAMPQLSPLIWNP